jgi:hypothetical protein
MRIHVTKQKGSLQNPIHALKRLFSTYPTNIEIHMKYRNPENLSPLIRSMPNPSKERVKIALAHYPAISRYYSEISRYYADCAQTNEELNQQRMSVGRSGIVRQRPGDQRPSGPAITKP